MNTTKRNRLTRALLFTASLIILVRGEDSLAVARNLQDCPPSVEGGENTFEFSQELGSQILKSIDLVDIVDAINLFSPECVSVEGSGFESLECFSDINDVALVARDGSTCYAAFRGTDFFNIFDTAQLFYQAQEDYDGCSVSSSIRSAYISDYYDDFRAAVATCMESGSELVLTGFSQGGAIAVLGSIDLREYNPKVISFAAIRALAEPCGWVGSSRHYRFVNTGDGQYDAWPADFGRDNLIHVGHAFLLDSGATNPASYLGLDADIELSPTSLWLHNEGLYRSGLQQLVPIDGSCFPVAVGGWETGHCCTKDEECQTRICFSEQCADDSVTKLGMGDDCSDDTQCQSGFCRWIWWPFVRQCV